MASIAHNAPATIGPNASFGFGDRIGLATPGHIAAMRRSGCGIAPIFAQQSIREMTRTCRSPEGVMADALEALQVAGWTAPHGADADHLKTTEDVDRTAAAGFTFFTIDPSGAVDQQADDYADNVVEERFATIRAETPWVDHYVGRSLTLPNGTRLDFERAPLMRAAVKYGRAIEATVNLANYISEVQEQAGRPYEIELSVDETPQPTTLVEHYVIAEQCLRRGVKLVSLAPRFIGELEKGVDYIGPIEPLEASLADHAAIAEHLGPYKLSLHSGSDKISMYPSLARATRGRFHVKTAGTSYLEALRVAAIEAPELFREICDFSRQRYDTDRATYHVHATLEEVPPQAEVADDLKLQDLYLERWENVPEGSPDPRGLAPRVNKIRGLEGPRSTPTILNNSPLFRGALGPEAPKPPEKVGRTIQKRGIHASHLAHESYAPGGRAPRGRIVANRDLRSAC
jgi:tagaturonate epimerase